ncbi:uncharacterized protein EI97DRAFT_12628 [Westerdykella ornata]|uniref:Uncharacterized protein n=1 Tax=Westerdykella ornata TaxID=318751 RepID=A0A6A6JYR6_WESOR|nr:uncharacterized protein EI97DRAFT_12628 [Westerdykella ornata]KAF2280896.1 hypothetical protein EI97DRAFT_12628 [Westerdykella ornata]
MTHVEVSVGLGTCSVFREGVRNANTPRKGNGNKADSQPANQSPQMPQIQVNLNHRRAYLHLGTKVGPGRCIGMVVRTSASSPEVRPEGAVNGGCAGIWAHKGGPRSHTRKNEGMKG